MAAQSMATERDGESQWKLEHAGSIRESGGMPAGLGHGVADGVVPTRRITLHQQPAAPLG